MDALTEARKQEFIRGVYAELEGCSWNEDGYPDNCWFESEESELGRHLGRIYLNKHE